MTKTYSYPFINDDDWQEFQECFDDIETHEIIDVKSRAVIDGKFCKARVYYVTGTFARKWKNIEPDHNKYVFQIGEHENVHGHFVNIDITELLSKTGHCPWQRSSYWAADSCMDPDRTKRIHLPTVDITDEECWDTLWGMIQGLRSYDGKNIQSMNMDKWWNVEDMWWVGPFCIGDLHGLEAFQKYHQSRFLSFIPDRDGSKGTQKVIYTEGNKAALMGHPSMSCTHVGEYFGFSPLEPARQPRLFVNDFWTSKDGKLVDNWCQIDMIDLFRSISEEYTQYIDTVLCYDA